MKNIPQIPFYFIRHGQTDWNLENKIQGHINIPLNEAGIKQALNAAPFFIDKGITRIITSPLARAHKTAEIINETLKVPLYTHEGLKERCLGELEGTLKNNAALANIDTNYTQQAKSSELIDDFKIRIMNTLNEILSEDEITLIVAHGGIYWALMNIMGFSNQRSSNATPYFFDLERKNNKQEWTIKIL